MLIISFLFFFFFFLFRLQLIHSESERWTYDDMFLAFLSVCGPTIHLLVSAASSNRLRTCSIYIYIYIYIYNRLRTCCSCVMWGSIHVNRTVCPYLSYWLQFLSCSDLINYYFYKDQESLSSLEYLDLSGNNINKLITSRDK
jgi:Leucine-rich repeat (LRR) protein